MAALLVPSNKSAETSGSAMAVTIWKIGGTNASKNGSTSDSTASAATMHQAAQAKVCVLASKRL